MTDAVAPPPLPAPDELTRFFWDGAREHRLLLQRCAACGTYQHPPEPVCHVCLCFDLGPGEVSGNATVYSYEWARQAFHPWFADRLPLCIAVVELVEQRGLRMVTNIVDTGPGGIDVGDRVRVDFEPLGADYVMPVFRPAG